MALSKIKQKKAVKRLNARITSWDRLPTDLKGKENGYTKPGSNRR